MIRFNNYEELLKFFPYGRFYQAYISQEVGTILESYGTDIVNSKDEAPDRFYNIEVDDKKYKLGITSIEVCKEDGDYDYCYWIEGNDV